MKTSKWAIAEFGDIHLGHPRTPTALIVDNLWKALPDNAQTSELDLVILAGDIFDRQIPFSDDNTVYVHLWIHSLLKLCVKHGIILRVLEGTRSHDWGQPREIVRLNGTYGIGADVRYIDTLELEWIAPLEMRVLWVPDEYRVKAIDTQREVESLLSEKGWDKVDFTVLHGMFTHQAPPGAQGKLDTHDPQWYQSITRYFVFGAHIHQQSVYGNILAAASFDRLSHGDEGPKGHYRVFVHSDGTANSVHVENKGAKIYKSFNVPIMGAEEAIKWILKRVEGYPEGSAFRLVGELQNPAMGILSALRELKPEFEWSEKPISKETDSLPLLVDRRAGIPFIPITRESIVELTLARLKTLTLKDRLDRPEALLKEVLND